MDVGHAILLRILHSDFSTTTESDSSLLLFMLKAQEKLVGIFPLLYLLLVDWRDTMKEIIRRYEL